MEIIKRISINRKIAIMNLDMIISKPHVAELRNMNEKLKSSVTTNKDQRESDVSHSFANKTSRIFTN